MFPTGIWTHDLSMRRQLLFHCDVPWHKIYELSICYFQLKGNAYFEFGHLDGKSIYHKFNSFKRSRGSSSKLDFLFRNRKLLWRKTCRGCILNSDLIIVVCTLGRQAGPYLLTCTPTHPPNCSLAIPAIIHFCNFPTGHTLNVAVLHSRSGIDIMNFGLMLMFVKARRIGPRIVGMRWKQICWPLR